jgi:hypothetical protein
MKLRSLINFGQAIPVVTGVNIHFGDGESIQISVVILEQKNQIVQQKFMDSSVRSLSELEELLLKKIPNGSRIHVNVEGKGVLLKAVPKNGSTNHRTSMKSVFPLINEEEFVSQLYSSIEQDFLQIARIDILANLRQLYNRYAWISFSLGTFIAGTLIPVLQCEKISIRNYSLRIGEKKITDVNPNSELDNSPVVFAQESVSPDVFLAYCSAWYLLLGNSDLTISEWGPERKAVENYKANVHLHRAGKWSLIVILIALLLNTILYFNLQKDISNLEAQESFVSNRYKKATELQQQSRKLREVYTSIGWRSNLVPIFYADQIALLVPSEIQLTSLDIGVLDENLLKAERKQVYQTTLIQVEGLTKDPISLHEMMESLEKYHWVAEIYQHRYRHDIRQNLGVFEFVIRIK